MDVYKEYACLGISMLLFLALPLNCMQLSHAENQEDLEGAAAAMEQSPITESEETQEQQPPVQQQGYNQSLDNMEEELDELKKDLKELKKRRRQGR